MKKALPLVVLVLAVAGGILAVGLPRILERHDGPTLYLPDQVASTDDIQQFDITWNGMVSLQKRAKKLGPEAFKEEYLTLMIEFLTLEESEEKVFRSAVDQALVTLSQARTRMLKKQAQALAADSGNADTSTTWSGESKKSLEARHDAWEVLRKEQMVASDLLLPALGQKPRHQLLVERRLDFLLRLEYSIRASAPNESAASSSKAS